MPGEAATAAAGVSARRGLERGAATVLPTAERRWEAVRAQARRRLSGASASQPTGWNNVTADCNMEQQETVGSGQVLRIGTPAGSVPVAATIDRARTSKSPESPRNHFHVTDGGKLEAVRGF